MRNRFVFLLFLTACMAASATERSIRVAIPDAIQPFALPKENAGLLVDMVREAFALEGITAQFIYMPVLRMKLEYSNHRVDVATNAKPDTGHVGYLTHWPLRTLRNRAITLKSRIPKLDSIEEMKDLRIVAFQSAHLNLGQQFADMAAGNRNYIETAHLPVGMLAADRTDVMISQPDIFLYWLHNETPGALQVGRDQIAFHDLFGAGNKYWFAFHSESMRDLFERGVQRLYANGRIDAIVDKYAVKYGTAREVLLELDCRFLKHARPKACASLVP